MATPVQLRRMVRYIFPMGKHSPRAGWCILLLDRYNHVFLIFILIDKHNYLLDFLSQLITMKMWVMDSRDERGGNALPPLIPSVFRRKTYRGRLVVK